MLALALSREEERMVAGREEENRTVRGRKKREGKEKEKKNEIKNNFFSLYSVKRIYKESFKDPIDVYVL